MALSSKLICHDGLQTQWQPTVLLLGARNKSIQGLPTKQKLNKKLNRRTAKNRGFIPDQ